MIGGPCAALLYDNFFKLPALSLPSPLPSMANANGDGDSIDRSISMSAASASMSEPAPRMDDRAARTARLAGGGMGGSSRYAAAPVGLPGQSFATADGEVSGLPGSTVAMNPLNMLTTAPIRPEEITGGVNSGLAEVNIADAYALASQLSEPTGQGPQQWR
jgi:hypothetical protein